LAIALFERRSNAQPNISVLGIGIGLLASGSGLAGIKRRDSVISRPDRAITTICRSKFVGADRAFGSPRASVSAAPVSPPRARSSRAQPDRLNSNLWTRYPSDWN